MAFILLAAYLVEHVGRVRLLVVSNATIAMAQLLLGLSFSLGHVVPLALAGQMLFMAAFSIGVGPCAMMVASELFPLQIRGFGAPARAGCVAGQWRAEAAARRDGRAASGREDVARDAAPPPTLPQRPRRWGSAPAALTSPLDSLCALAWAPATARADSTRRCHAHQSRHLRHGRSLLPLPLARAHTRGRLLSLRSPRVVCHRVHATLRARDEGCALAACARETPRLFSSAPPILSVTPVHPCTPPPLPPPSPRCPLIPERCPSACVYTPIRLAAGKSLEEIEREIAEQYLPTQELLASSSGAASVGRSSSARCRIAAEDSTNMVEAPAATEMDAAVGHYVGEPAVPQKRVAPV